MDFLLLESTQNLTKYNLIMDRTESRDAIASKNSKKSGDIAHWAGNCF